MPKETDLWPVLRFGVEMGSPFPAHSPVPKNPHANPRAPGLQRPSPCRHMNAKQAARPVIFMRHIGGVPAMAVDNGIPPAMVHHLRIHRPPSTTPTEDVGAGRPVCPFLHPQRGLGDMPCSRDGDHVCNRSVHYRSRNAWKRPIAAKHTFRAFLLDPSLRIVQDCQVRVLEMAFPQVADQIRAGHCVILKDQRIWNAALDDHF